MSSNINVSFPLRNFLYLHLAYLEKTNGKSPFFCVPIHPDLLDELKKSQITAIFDDKTGIQIQINQGEQARIVRALLADPKNLTSQYYQTITEWHDVSSINESYYSEIEEKTFECELVTTDALLYQSQFLPRKPDQSLSLKMPGLENDILQISLEPIFELHSFMKSTAEWVEGYPIREEKRLAVDLGFRQCALQVIEEFPPDHTFYIVNTGHSIPVGALLSSTYQMTCTVFMRQCGLSTPNHFRLISQLTSFGAEIEATSTTTLCESFVWLLDCHTGEVTSYDKNRGRNIINFSKATYLNRMPKPDDLKEKGIKKVVVMVEFSPQIHVEIEDLKSTPYSSFAPYLESLQNEKFEVFIRGVDCRFDTTKIVKAETL